VGTGCLLAQHLVDIVSCCFVVQRHGVGVVAKGRGGISMPEALLCLDKVSTADQVGGESAARPMEADPVDPGFVSQLAEPVAESAGHQTPAVVRPE